MAHALRMSGLATVMAAVTMAGAKPIDVHKNDVIAVRFDSRLSTDDSRVGDTFTATPEGDAVFPRGTRFDGHVERVTAKAPHHPASMDLAFDDVRLPDGSRHAIRGVPVPLTSKYVDRDRYGHYVAKAQVRKEAAVGVGAAAGLLIGALLHKPFEGTFIGTLAGILVADTAGEDGALVINRDSESGVLFQRDERFDAEDAAVSTPDISPLRVSIAGQGLQYSDDLAPYRAGSTLMVPIQATVKQLGLSYDESESSIFTENDNHSLRFEQNSRSYRVDGRADTLDTSVVRRNGVWYAPARAFEAIARQ